MKKVLVTPPSRVALVDGFFTAKGLSTDSHGIVGVRIDSKPFPCFAGSPKPVHEAKDIKGARDLALHGCQEVTTNGQIQNT